MKTKNLLSSLALATVVLTPLLVTNQAQAGERYDNYRDYRQDRHEYRHERRHDDRPVPPGFRHHDLPRRHKHLFVRQGHRSTGAQGGKCRAESYTVMLK